MRYPHRITARAGCVVTSALVVSGLLAVPAQADTHPPLIEDGRTQPVFDYAEAVYHEVDIETEADSDGDGTPDTVRMRIMRPKETDEGLRVPTIIEPSPYWAGLNSVDFYDVDLDDEDAGTVPRTRGGERAGGLGDLDAPADPEELRRSRAAGGPGVSMPNYYDNYFLPRGYAVAQLDSLGTGGSTGCPTSGAHNETLGAKAAVDWLNGRATGRDPEGNEVTADDWSTGNVAMTGISYNGTLPVAAATTGVEGLKAIVPQGAISSWYEYYRENGGVVAPGGYQGEDADILAELVHTREDREACRPVLDAITEEQDRRTGDYSAFWDERNYRNDVADISAGVFLAHGLNDWNVKTDQALRMWRELGEHGVPRKLWLYQAGHVNPMNLRIEEWLDQLHGWFDYWLYDLDNGIMDGPAVDIENADFGWSTQDDWPPAGTAPLRLHMNAAAEDADGGAGTLGRAPAPGRDQRESFTDAGRTTTADALATDPAAAGKNSLVYLSEELADDVRVSGFPEVSLRAAMDGASPYLTALLVDYGTDTRATGPVRFDRDERVCYGEGIPEDPGCTFRSYPVTATSDHKIVTRGILDARNRASMERQLPVVGGTMYRYSWEMQGQDYVFKAGHRIGVVVISTDYDYTLRYPAGTDVTLDTAAATVTLPVSQGRDGYRG
ncbi:X-Pro dipeptidyl-peptidase [Nocardiopsis mwathae]|uniref:Xaa-Pro dipeptidyl-peptidase n=1 Tax=Nocardiopsis mwathae TaxID=1472723 RepID=A0A7W9YI87_9ACTN|nr:Xaa-Pro dipeptidyl-peptidase [Nocardiopsis mwathae]MBB6172660.1 X-Pro dipeptidyl-peptidase [Nocardiopsis mwathae]